MKLTKEQTQTIIDNGKTKGFSGKTILDGLISRGYEPEGIDIPSAKQAIQKEQKVPEVTQPSEQTPSAFQRIATGIKEKGANVADAISGEGEFTGKSSIERGVSATAQAFSAISGTVYNALPDEARGVLDKIGGGIGKGINYIADKISDSKELQDIVSTGDVSKLESALKITSDLGLISGEVAGTKGVTKSITSTVDAVGTGINKIKTGVVSTVKDLASSTEGLSKYPKVISDAITEKITRIEPKVKNILDTASIEKFDNYVKAGETAISNPRALTPLEIAGDKLNKVILPTIKEDLGKIGTQMSKSLEVVKNIQVPNASLDAIKFLKDSVKGMKLTLEESKLIRQAVSDLELGKSPTIGTLDKTVNLLQSTLFEKAGNLSIPVTSRVKSLVNQTIGKLNTTLKKAAKDALKSDEYTLLNSEYATRVKLFQNLNKLLQNEGKRGGSIFKRFFSPQDAGMKNIFKEIKDLYGVDLAEDAVLAKFVMESLGDTRASSLLQMVPTSKMGVVTKGLNLLEDKLTNPIKKARGIIESKSQVKLK